MTTIDFHAIEFDSAHEAIQHRNAGGYGDCVIQLNRMCYLTRQAEADRLAAAGVEFAYAFDYEMADGSHRIMTVPIN